MTRIAAAARSWNACCGCLVHVKICTGRRRVRLCQELVEQAARRREEARDGAHEQQRRRLAEGAGEGDDHARQDPGQRVRQDVAADDLPSSRPDAVGGLADRPRHGPQRLRPS